MAFVRVERSAGPLMRSPRNLHLASCSVWSRSFTDLLVTGDARSMGKRMRSP